MGLLPDSSLDQLSSLVERVAGSLRELKTENIKLKEEIRQLEQEVEELRGELGVSREELVRLRQTRIRVRRLAKRVLDNLASIENSGDEIDVTS